jgi:hypothetical protein
MAIRLYYCNLLSKQCVAKPQMMDIVKMAIHPVVCQKSDFHRNIDFPSSQKVDLLQIPGKISRQKYASL